jgi:hypothetical protein
MGIVDDIQLVYYGQQDDGDDNKNDDDGDGPKRHNADSNDRHHHRHIRPHLRREENDVNTFFNWKFGSKSYVQKLWNDNRSQLQILEPIFPNLAVLFTTGDGNDKNIKDKKDNKNVDDTGPTVTNSHTTLSSPVAGGDITVVDEFNEGDDVSATSAHISEEINNKQAVQLAFCRFFDILTVLAPVVVLVLDDLQWCSDESTLEVVDALLLRRHSATNISSIRGSNAARLLIVGTVRTDGETTKTSAHHTLPDLLSRYQQYQTIVQRHNSVSLSRTRTVNLKVHELSTEDLDVHDIVQWLLALQHAEDERVRKDHDLSPTVSSHRRREQEHHLVPLAECIARRTGGNA